MTCFKPITVWTPTRSSLEQAPQQYYDDKKISFRERPNRRKITIPCGNCLGCRLDKANEWATRITCESKMHSKNCFITLTYNNNNLPKNLELKKKDIQDFIKRLRYYYPDINIKYFGCGEYGPKGGRPHYHLAIFNWIPDDLKIYKQNQHGDNIFTSKKLYEIWGKGFAPVEDLNYTTACYIARYVQKKAGLEKNKREYTGEIEETKKIDERTGKIFTYIINKTKTKQHLIQPEFILMSQGIGKDYWKKNKELIKRNMGIPIKIQDKVKIKPIPRYFQKLWEKENSEELYHYKMKIQNRFEKSRSDLLKKVGLKDKKCEELTNDQKIKLYNEITEHNLQVKASKLKRNEFI